MADQEPSDSDSSAGGTNQAGNSQNGDDRTHHTNGDLEQFIHEQHALQMEHGDSGEVDADRTANFFNRALSESRRMNAEVVKSEKKLDNLHEELGAENFSTWTRQHASEVLATDTESKESS